MPSHQPCSLAQVMKSLSCLQPRARGRILQPLGELLRPALADPEREERAPAVEHRGVRILIGRDVEAARPRLLDLLDVLADRALSSPCRGS